MKKQGFTILLILLISMISTKALADASGKCGDNVTWTYVEATQTLTISGNGAMYNYNYDGFPWYSFREKLKTAVIEEGVTSIGNYAFFKCTGLTSITIPNSVTSIGYYTFAYCYRLISVTIPNSVTSIGIRAFYECSDLTSVTIGNSVTSIGSGAFYECSGLTSVTIPNSVTSIGDRAFSGCSGLTSITIPNSVTSIGEYAFYGCSGLTSIKVELDNTKYDSRNNCNAIIETSTNKLISGCNNTIIPNSVTSIGDDAFYGCSGLTSVTIPNSVTNIGSGTFYGCSGLTSVTIPNSVTSIGDRAFSGCSGLTSITIPNSVTSIGDVAFYECSGLTSVTIPNSVTSIGLSAFYGCRLENVMTHNSSTSCKNAFSDRTYQHAMLYIPEGTWGEAVYDGDWYQFNNIRETAMKAESLSPSRAYTLMDTKTFGYAVYNAASDEVKMVKAFYSIDEQDPNNCWQLITQAGKKYLYNMGAKKYATIAADGKILLTATATAISLADGDDGVMLGADTSRQWGFVKNNALPDMTGIESQTFFDSQTPEAVYTLDGQHIAKPKKGLNIVKMNNGQTRKLVVR